MSRSPRLGSVLPTRRRSLRLSRLPSSLSQFEEAIGHGRGRRGGDGQPLVDCFQDEAAVEAPGEGAEVARQMFGRDGAVRGQEAVLTNPRVKNVAFSGLL